MLILLFLAILPVILLGLFIYWNDKIEKEPVWLLVVLGACGLGAVIITLIITWILELAIPFFASTEEELGLIQLAIYVFFGVALIEEFSKWFFTTIVTWKSKEFNHIYDAIVYCVFVSLGFAGIENVLYVITQGNIISSFVVAIMRMIMSVPGHVFFAIFMGFFLGKAKKASLERKGGLVPLYLFLSVLTPAFIHFVYDFLLMANYFLPALLLIIFLYVICTIMVVKIGRINSMLPGFVLPLKITRYFYNGYQYNQQPVGHPMYQQPVNQPMYQQPVNQQMYQQSVNQQMYQQPVNQPMYQQPVNQPMYQQPVNQPMYQQPVNQPMYQQPVNQPMYQQPMNQPMYQQPVNQPVNNMTYPSDNYQPGVDISNQNKI